ncbi:hypothetical protein JXA47_07540 [Candidatus Sumerlaeota bacterium]|nr:hypothetical protein [Candidatus Sumerlaeota bacterium]
MRLLAILSTLAIGLAALTGCTTLSGGTSGALIGGLTGAGIGAIAGDPTAGALIGTGVGAAGGALIGHSNEQQRRQEGWVYDNAWGTSGHYENTYYSYGPPPVSCPQPTRIQPAAYYPTSGYQTPGPRFTYTPEQPDRLIINQPRHVWYH